MFVAGILYEKHHVWCTSIIGIYSSYEDAAKCTIKYLIEAQRLFVLDETTFNEDIYIDCPTYKEYKALKYKYKNCEVPILNQWEQMYELVDAYANDEHPWDFFIIEEAITKPPTGRKEFFSRALYYIQKTTNLYIPHIVSDIYNGFADYVEN